MTRLAKLLLSVSAAVTLLAVSGCYKDPAAEEGTLYARAEEQRQYANNLIQHPINYAPPFSSSESSYAQVYPTSITLTSEEVYDDEERLNVTGDQHTFLFGLFSFIDY